MLLPANMPGVEGGGLRPSPPRKTRTFRTEQIKNEKIDAKTMLEVSETHWWFLFIRKPLSPVMTPDEGKETNL